MIRRTPRDWSRGRSTRGPTYRRSTCSAAMTASSRPSGCAGSSANGLASPPTRSTADIALPSAARGSCPSVWRRTGRHSALPTPNRTLSAPSHQLGRLLATRGQFLSRRSNPTGRSTMRRTLTLILGVALFGILAAVVVASQGADDPAGATGTTTTTETQDAPPRSRTTPPARALTTTPRTGRRRHLRPVRRGRARQRPPLRRAGARQPGTGQPGARPGRRGHLRPV